MQAYRANGVRPCHLTVPNRVHGNHAHASSNPKLQLSIQEFAKTHLSIQVPNHVKKPLRISSKKSVCKEGGLAHAPSLPNSRETPSFLGYRSVRHSSTLARLPIGLQTLPKIIHENFVYIDKTEEAYNILTKGSGRYFYAAPRRFGKSLFLSTLEEIVKGKKKIHLKTYGLEKVTINGINTL